MQTTTIGLRHELVQRSVLQRTTTSIDGLPAKEVVRPGGRRTVKIEADALAEQAMSADERAGLRQRSRRIEPR